LIKVKAGEIYKFFVGILPKIELIYAKMELIH